MTGTWRQRGVAYWTDGEDDERIFWGTGNGYLVCVDAKTGEPCADFGEGGMVDVRLDREAHHHVVRGEFRCGVVGEPHQELALGQLHGAFV